MLGIGVGYCARVLDVDHGTGVGNTYTCIRPTEKGV